MGNKYEKVHIYMLRGLIDLWMKPIYMPRLATLTEKSISTLLQDLYRLGLHSIYGASLHLLWIFASMIHSFF